MEDIGKLRNLWLQKMELWQNMWFMPHKSFSIWHKMASNGKKNTSVFFNFAKNKLYFISFCIYICFCLKHFPCVSWKKDLIYWFKFSHATRSKKTCKFSGLQVLSLFFTNTVKKKKFFLFYGFLKKKKKNIFDVRQTLHQRKEICGNYWANTLHFYFPN